MLISIRELLEAKRDPSADNVNSQLRHCMVAVAKKKGGETEKGASAAWNICRHSLTQKGYMKGPYRKDAPASSKKATQATQKGARSSMKHTYDKASGKKRREFGRLWKKASPKIRGG